VKGKATARESKLSDVPCSESPEALEGIHALLAFRMDRASWMMDDGSWVDRWILERWIDLA